MRWFSANLITSGSALLSFALSKNSHRLIELIFEDTPMVSFHWSQCVNKSKSPI
jgi:hypothetical protein